MRKLIDVKKSHIRKGGPNVDDGTSCTIALALQAAFPGKEVHCCFDYAIFYEGSEEVKRMPLPKSAQRCQQRLFRDKKVEPFTFAVTV